MTQAEKGDPAQGANDPAQAYVVKDPQTFAMNIARLMAEAGKAASAWADPRLKAVGTQDPALEPVADMVRTFSKVTEYWLAEPSRALEAQTRLFAGFFEIWSNAVHKLNDAAAPDVVAPLPTDKRFRDEDWSRNAFFDFLKQTYLVFAKWAGDLVERAEGLDPHTRHKAEFYVKQITTAISPSNFILTNPELFRETVASNGENLVRGMKNLADDIMAGGGDLKLRQSDTSLFEIGRNIAVTPGTVIARNDLVEIIQYEPTTPKVLKRPLLICPPWINKFYILDLNPEKSFIRWAVSRGHTVFVISWVNPDQRHGRLTWEDYIRDGIGFALDTIETETGEREVNTIGYCVGGTLLSAGLALHAREGERRIRSATLFTTQVDFTHAGDLKVFADEEQVRALEQAMSERGYLEGNRMATAFNLLRSGDLIWPYVINNYMRGKEPLPFDLLYWNSDSTRMGAANHSFYLRNCYLENRLSRGEMVLDGKPVSLSDVSIPIYNLSAKEDHIAPARSVFVGCRYFGGDVEFVMAGSGHIAGVINPPAANKYQYWTGRKPEGEFDDWVASASQTAGSWWPNWQAWIEKQDKRRTAAREPGRKLANLGAAPGDYVRVRA